MKLPEPAEGAFQSGINMMLRLNRKGDSFTRKIYDALEDRNCKFVLKEMKKLSQYVEEVISHLEDYIESQKVKK